MNRDSPLKRLVDKTIQDLMRLGLKPYNAEVILESCESTRSVKFIFRSLKYEFTWKCLEIGSKEPPICVTELTLSPKDRGKLIIQVFPGHGWRVRYEGDTRFDGIIFQDLKLIFFNFPDRELRRFQLAIMRQNGFQGRDPNVIGKLVEQIIFVWNDWEGFHIPFSQSAEEDLKTVLCQSVQQLGSFQFVPKGRLLGGSDLGIVELEATDNLRRQTRLPFKIDFHGQSFSIAWYLKVTKEGHVLAAPSMSPKLGLSEDPIYFWLGTLEEPLAQFRGRSSGKYYFESIIRKMNQHLP